MAVATEATPKTAVTVFIAGNTTNGAALHKDGSVSKLSVI